MERNAFGQCWGEGIPLKPSRVPTRERSNSLPDYARYLRRRANEDQPDPLWATLADEAERYLDLRSLI